MTGDYTALGTLIDIAKEDAAIAKVFLDVAPKIMREISCQYNQAIRHFLESVDELTFGQWDDFVSDVRDLDHKTNRKVFSKKGKNLLDQLLILFGLEYNPYEQSTVGIRYRSDFRSLFKYSEVAKDYFFANYKHVSKILWIKKGLNKT